MDVYLASGNAHKYEEFASMILKARLPLGFHPAASIGGMPHVEETGETFAENARIKAVALAAQARKGAWILADDSGLVVDALGGEPGVRSARYAGPGNHAAANNLKLLKELRTVQMPQRSARFICVLCFLEVGGELRFFEGSCEGHILPEPHGSKGFGYDPVFRPLGYSRSFGELGSAIKNNLSHRARAVQAWMDYVRTLCPDCPDPA
jgi:XTP/dITP diphosphohydrolase